MSRELWADEKCVHDSEEDHFLCDEVGYPEYDEMEHTKERCHCPGGGRTPLDFDTIWERYYTLEDRRFLPGLTYNELWEVVYGGKKEEDECTTS